MESVYIQAYQYIISKHLLCFQIWWCWASFPVSSSWPRKACWEKKDCRAMMDLSSLKPHSRPNEHSSSSRLCPSLSSLESKFPHTSESAEIGDFLMLTLQATSFQSKTSASLFPLDTYSMCYLLCSVNIFKVHFELLTTWKAGWLLLRTLITVKHLLSRDVSRTPLSGKR